MRTRDSDIRLEAAFWASPVPRIITTRSHKGYEVFRMQFWKVHALGNNFVFVLHSDEENYPVLAERLCRRDVAIGADGLLSLDLHVRPPTVRMWNPDGTPDFCGNGMCCAAFLARALTGEAIDILGTPTVSVPVRVGRSHNNSAPVSIGIPHPTFDPAAIPLATEHGKALKKGQQLIVDGRSFDVIPSSNGNIHTVIFVDKLPEDAEFERVSPLIEKHPLFPAKTNVLWCVALENRLVMRIWERSVGETSACGTGAAAAVAICDYVGRPLPPTVDVTMSGGTVQVTTTTNYIELTTRVTLVFQGQLC